MAKSSKKNALAVVAEAKFQRSIYTMAPATCVKLLDQCGGDLDKYCAAFHITDEAAKNMLLVRTQQIFERNQADIEYAKWKKLLQQFNEAKWLMFQRKAIHKLDGMHAQDLTQAQVNSILGYARFALAEDLEERRAQARKFGSQVVVKNEADLFLEKEVLRLNEKLDQELSDRKPQEEVADASQEATISD